jgi:cation:H+ antiporter
VAVGNVVGSNLFNLLGILGASACITPLPVSAAMGRDLGWMVGAAVVLGVAFAPRGQMGRWRGALLVALAVVYTVGLTV